MSGLSYFVTMLCYIMKLEWMLLFYDIIFGLDTMIMYF